MVSESGSTMVVSRAGGRKRKWICSKDLCVTLNLWLNCILYFKLCWNRCCVRCVLFFPSLLISLPPYFFPSSSMCPWWDSVLCTPLISPMNVPFCASLSSLITSVAFFEVPIQSLSNCHSDGDLSSLLAIELQIVL